MHIKDIFLFIFSVYALLWFCIIALTLYAWIVHKIKGLIKRV